MQESIDESKNPLEDRRVLLSLDVDDIKEKAKEMKIPLKRIDFDEVFRLTRKGIESNMDIFWMSLELALEEQR